MAMQRLGRYEITGELGRGGMGVVYRARDARINRDVAIKTLRLSEISESTEREELQFRLQREAQSAGSLRHIGIVSVYELGEEGDLSYIVMECVNGPTLKKLVSDGAKLDPLQIVAMLRQAAVALDFAHKKGIVHRDVKPANIMVDETGDVKITDFGLAKIQAADSRTRAGMLMGTPHYMAPEQIMGKSVDGRADQYGLAVIAFELLTGQRPFVADALPTLIHLILTADPPAVDQLNPDMDFGVDMVLRRALSKDPAQRYATCEDFIAALKEAVETRSLRTGMRSPDRVPTTQSEAATVQFVRCTHCGQSMPASTRFCAKCGSPVESALMTESRLRESPIGQLPGTEARTRTISAAEGIPYPVERAPAAPHMLKPVLGGLVVALVLGGGFFGWRYKVDQERKEQIRLEEQRKKEAEDRRLREVELARQRDEAARRQAQEEIARLQREAEALRQRGAQLDQKEKERLAQIEKDRAAQIEQDRLAEQERQRRERERQLAQQNPPVVPQPRVSPPPCDSDYSGNVTGTLNWAGSLPPGGRLTIGKRIVIEGGGAVVSGGMPGIPAQVVRVGPPGVIVEQEPSTQNSCVVVLRNTTGAPVSTVVLGWREK